MGLKWRYMEDNKKERFATEEGISLWVIISILLLIRNEQATKETFDERGFLHSGDVGSIDKKGNLTITGRIKELIITAGGENVAPVLLENEVF